MGMASNASAMDYRKIITIEPGKRSGQPCIRGMRITVGDILEYLAGGMTIPELLEDFDELTEEDIRGFRGQPATPKTFAEGMEWADKVFTE